MSLIRNLVFLVLLFLAYYAGYREWGTDVLLGWLDNTGSVSYTHLTLPTKA